MVGISVKKIKWLQQMLFAIFIMERAVIARIKSLGLKRNAPPPS